MHYAEKHKGYENNNFSMKTWPFSYCCSKHRLWVHVRTVSMRRFWGISTIYDLGGKIRKNVCPCKPHFYYRGLHYTDILAWLILFLVNVSADLELARVFIFHNLNHNFTMSYSLRHGVCFLLYCWYRGNLTTVNASHVEEFVSIFVAVNIKTRILLTRSAKICFTTIKQSSKYSAHFHDFPFSVKSRLHVGERMLLITKWSCFCMLLTFCYICFIAYRIWLEIMMSINYCKQDSLDPHMINLTTYNDNSISPRVLQWKRQSQWISYTTSKVKHRVNIFLDKTVKNINLLLWYFWKR